MGADIVSLPFSELLSYVVDNRGKTCPTDSEGLPLIATNCVKNDALYPVFEKIRHVSDETYETWFRGHPLPGDLIFVCKGSPGAVCMTPNPVNFCIAQDMVAIRAERSLVRPKYLLALLRSERVQRQILNMHVGTLIPHFKKGDFKNLHLDIHRDVVVQEWIGSLYYEFCNKIEMNRRTSETLETMAQALFKSWFVDFDPVIDNALAAGNDIPEPLKSRAAARQALGDARKPLPEEIRREFPDEFEFRDEVGWVPQGWEIYSLDSIADYRNGLALQKYRPADDSEYLPVLKIAQLRVDEPTHAEKASVDISGDYVVHDGDVVFSWSGSLMLRIWCGGPAALNQHLFRVTSEKFPKWFYFGWTEAHLEDFKRAAADKAVTMGHIERSHLKEAKCVVPGARLLEHGTDYFAPILGRQIATRLESRALGSLRDTLLPKLLSGELTLPDAEKLAADVL